MSWLGRAGISLLGALACEYGGATDDRGQPRVAPAASVSVVASTERSPETVPPGAAFDDPREPESELQMLHRLRAHYRMASTLARSVASGASSAPVAREADWLVQVYDHVAEHFDSALLDWYGRGEADAPDRPSREFTPIATPSRAAELRFAHEALTAHRELVAYVRSPAYSRFAEGRELLREIRFDVETSQSAQLDALHATVREEPPR